MGCAGAKLCGVLATQRGATRTVTLTLAVTLTLSLSLTLALTLTPAPQELGGRRLRSPVLALTGPTPTQGPYPYSGAALPLFRVPRRARPTLPYPYPYPTLPYP